jgi:hypothetical protein
VLWIPIKLNFARYPLLIFFIASACSNIPDATTPTTDYKGSGFVTRGSGNATTSNLLASCSGGRVAAVGTIKSLDGVSWVVPAETSFTTGVKATDIYNECNNVTLSNINLLDLNSVPIVEIDANGDVIAGYIFADNYFELYVNGVLIAVDPVPYTPFNSSVLRFRVNKPYTIAVKLVDWEENLGLGSEGNNGNSYQPGDGGFIASFSDGTKTDATWKAQTYYISPVADLTLITEKSNGTRSSVGASPVPTCNGLCYGVHWQVPADWFSKTYNDSGWPSASTYSTQSVGVDNKPAFTNFSATWLDASFIWSSNLILDNVVLVRKNVN